MFKVIERSSKKYIDYDTLQIALLNQKKNHYQLSILGLPGRSLEYLQIIEEQAIKLGNQVEDILSAAKLESKRILYHFNVVNIHKLIDNAISSVKFSPKHRLICTIDPELSFIKADD